MAPEIRDYRDEDLPALVALQRACEPEHPLGAPAWRHADSVPDPRVLKGRLVWVADGELLGYAGYDQYSMIYDPWSFVLQGGVAPAARGRGIGSALYAALMERLAPQGPRALGVGLWLEQHAGQAWLAARGFAETLRETESELELASFPAGDFLLAQHRAEAGGYRFCSLAALGDDERRRRQVFALDMAFSVDIPMTRELTVPDYAVYEHLCFADPGYRPELCWLALAGDEPVALCWHMQGEAHGELGTCVTGVHSRHRGRGLALGLKSRTLADAAARGFERVRTRNATSNAGMLAVNAKLGYRACGARIIMEKELKA